VAVDPSFTGDTGSITVTVTAKPPAAAGPAAGMPANTAKPATASRTAPSPARPPRRPAAGKTAAKGPTFTFTIDSVSADLFYAGVPTGFAFQGYTDNDQYHATWTGHPNGAVTGAIDDNSFRFTWLLNDVCIIARLSASTGSAGYGGPYAPGELHLYPNPDGSASYLIALDPVYYDDVSTEWDFEFDTEDCVSGISRSTHTVMAHAAPSPIEGAIPPGQTSVSGHSFCGGYSSGTPIGQYYAATFCTIDWTVTK
jgi:hypothetical protein